MRVVEYKEEHPVEDGGPSRGWGLRGLGLFLTSDPACYWVWESVKLGLSDFSLSEIELEHWEVGSSTIQCIVPRKVRGLNWLSCHELGDAHPQLFFLRPFDLRLAGQH